MAAGDLTTVAKVREYLKLEDSLEDAYLATLVSAASAWMKSETGRDLLAANYVETFDGEGSSGLTLSNGPVASVTSVTVDGDPVPVRATPSDAGWVLRGDRLELVGYRFSRGVGNVTVSYRAGYEVIPEDLAQAVVMRAGLSYRDRDWAGMSSRIVAGESLDRRGTVDGGTWAYINGAVQKYRRPYL